MGKMERVSLIQDNGKITSYENVPTRANLKSNIINLDLSQYKHHRLHRTKSKSDLMTTSTSSVDLDSTRKSELSGITVERGDKFLGAMIHMLNQESTDNYDPLERDRNNAIKSRINEILGTDSDHDSISYLSSL